jgi:hypothetical protein
VPKAFYLISNNPIRLIVPKKSWKQSKVVEVHNSDHFEVTFHYICHLIDLPFCFNRQSRKFTHCSCHCSLSPEVAILVSNSLGKFFFYNVFFLGFLLHSHFISYCSFFCSAAYRDSSHFLEGTYSVCDELQINMSQ